MWWLVAMDVYVHEDTVILTEDCAFNFSGETSTNERKNGNRSGHTLKNAQIIMFAILWCQAHAHAHAHTHTPSLVGKKVRTKGRTQGERERGLRPPGLCLFGNCMSLCLPGIRDEWGISES